MELRFDLRGYAELSALWNRAPEICREELLATITEADLLLEHEIKEATPSSGHGTLQGSIISEEMSLADSVIGEVGTALNYAVPVELGSKPHMPPVEPLKDWVKQKLGVPAEEVDQVAWRVAMKIKQHGTKGAYMFTNTFAKHEQAIGRLFEEALIRIHNRLARI